MPYSADNSLKVLFVYPNELGPYHQDRLNAFVGQRGIETNTIEIVRKAPAGYLWRINEHSFCFPYEKVPLRYTLTRGLRAAVRFRPVVVVLHGYDCIQAVALAYILKMRGAIILIQCESNESSGNKGRLRWQTKRALVRVADGFLAPGPLQAAYFRKLSDGRKPVYETRYMGRNLAKLPAVKGEAPETDRDWLEHMCRGPYFLCVGRFVPFKRLSIVIQAFSEFLSQDPKRRDWRLVLSGDGPLQSSLKQLAVACGIESHVVFAGFQEGTKLGLLYRNARALVHMSDWADCHPMVVSEALGYGLPCILSHRVGNTYLIEESGAGWVVRAPEESNLVQALSECATDETAYRTRRERARSDQVVSSISTSAAATRTIEAILGCLATTRNG